LPDFVGDRGKSEHERVARGWRRLAGSRPQAAAFGFAIAHAQLFGETCCTHNVPRAATEEEI
jgi:hypothetical protein